MTGLGGLPTIGLRRNNAPGSTAHRPKTSETTSLGDIDRPTDRPGGDKTLSKQSDDLAGIAHHPECFTSQVIAEASVHWKDVPDRGATTAVSRLSARIPLGGSDARDQWCARPGVRTHPTLRDAGVGICSMVHIARGAPNGLSQPCFGLNAGVRKIGRSAAQAKNSERR